MIEKECRNCGEDFDDWNEDENNIYCDECKEWFEAKYYARRKKIKKWKQT